MSATPPRIQGAPPQVGEHTEAIMLDIGYTWPEILALRDRGAI